MLLRCRSCSAFYPLEMFLDEMDDGFEQKLGNIPVDRI
ncbi:MAG: dual CXXC motif small (seleno)protein [Desulfobacterales bacterium]|nr:dual CXXC motif small (seleno)protein [Desulfobacterales bacterium]